jgi:ubiquinone/menaquinone biosynthesis C-methylase UbiE
VTSAKPRSTRPKKQTRSGIAKGYLHGYTTAEQERLVQQARFLEPSVYQKVDFSSQRQILEVGSGVGAQTEILLERFPQITLSGIDASADQVECAKRRLAEHIGSGRVDVKLGDALHLPYAENSFDGAFVCWFLEHVQQPVEILKEMRRVLRPSAVIYCTEVLNATFYVHPYSPATLQYWFAFNDYQWTLKGDPFVGGKLANYLLAAGYQNVHTEVCVHHYDNRAPKRRAEFIEYWTKLLLSGAPGLIKAKKISPKVVQTMKKELARLKHDPDAVFFYCWVQAKAQAF